MSNTISSVFGQGMISIPDQGGNLSSILTAAQGGQQTAAFLSQQIPQSLFMQDIGLGNISIITSTLGFTGKDGKWHDTGIPVTFSMEGSGENALTLVTYVSVLKSVWEQMKHSDPAAVDMQAELRISDRRDIVVGRFADVLIDDPARYRGLRLTADETCDCSGDCCVIGAIHNTFAYSQNPIWYGTLPITVGTTLASLPLGLVAFPQFVKPALKAFWAGEKEIWATMGSAFDMAGTMSVLSSGAEAATAEEVVGEGAEAVTLGFTAAGVVCFGAILALAAIPLVVSKLAHYSYHYLTVYNLSNTYDLVWNVPYIFNGTMNNAPVVSDDDDTYQQLIPGLRTTQPTPHVAPVESYHSAPFSFASKSAYAGLGDSFGFTLYPIDPNATFASDYDGVTPAGYGGYVFDIPWAGDNSLGCCFSEEPIDSDSYWDTAEKRQVTQYSVTNTELNIKLTVTFDYLDGTHPNNQGLEEYYYQSIVTLEDLA